MGATSRTFTYQGSLSTRNGDIAYIYGLEYHFERDRFLVWSEYQDNHGNGWNGQGYEDAEDEWTLGIRYYF